MRQEEWSRETWNEGVKALREKIPDIYPAWTDFNLHDPGITIMELFVWMQQAQIYRIYQIGEAHRKKYCKLLGMKPISRKPGRTMVTLVTKGSRYIKAGTGFYADNICFETREGQFVTEGIFRRFTSMGSNGETVLEGDWIAEGKGLSLLPFGERPEPDSCLEIRLGQPLEEQGMHRLFLECFQRYRGKGRAVDESAYDGHGFYPLARIRMEYLGEDGWKEARVIRDETYAMVQDGSICFELGSPMKKDDFRLRFRLVQCSYLLPPCITRISLAMAEAWQQETVKNLPEFRGDGFACQSFELEQGDIDPDSFCLQAEDAERPGEMLTWRRVEDFDNSSAEDRDYTLERGVLRFGDGFKGMMPEGKIQVIRMIRTRGDAGNIKAGAINRTSEPGIESLTNEYDVTGGAREETVEEVFARYLKEREIPKRAVTFKDYETLVMFIPGLMIERCTVYGGAAGSRTVTIVVKPWSLEPCGMLNEAYKKNLYRYLEEKRLIGTRLEVVSPEYYQVEITCVVSAKVQYRHAGETVEEAVKKWIRQKGFGEGISYGELAGRIESLPCVQKMTSLWIDAGSRGKRDSAGDLLLPSHGLLILKKVSCHLMGAGEEQREA